MVDEWWIRDQCHKCDKCDDDDDDDEEEEEEEDEENWFALSRCLHQKFVSQDMLNYLE